MLIEVQPTGGQTDQPTAELSQVSRFHTMYWYKSALPWSGGAKGLSQAMENGWPNTTFRFIHFDFLAHRLSSFFSCSIPVSSVQMEWTCVPNMTAVKIRKRRPSKQRRMRRTTVAGGEKLLHFVQSSSMQKTKWKATMTSEWKDISAIYIVHPGTVVVHLFDAAFAHTAVVSSVGLDAAALGTLVHHLSWF